MDNPNVVLQTDRTGRTAPVALTAGIRPTPYGKRRAGMKLAYLRRGSPLLWQDKRP